MNPKPYCYNCGHLLKNHRASGRCTRCEIINFNNPQYKICPHYQEVYTEEHIQELLSE